MASWRDRLHTRLANGLYEEVSSGARTSGGLVRYVTYAVALLVHLFTLALVALGVWLVTRPGFMGIILGLGAFALVWLVAPRPAKLPDGILLTHDDAPELHELVAEIAQAVRAPRPHVILIDGQVNAAFGTYGLLRRRYLVLGYPVWLALEPQERIALIGHELGHAVNQDTRHGLVVGSALDSLAELWNTSRISDEGPLAWAGMLLAWPVRLVVGWLYLLLELLTYRANQRAEYRADLISLRVAGSSAAVSIMDKSLHSLNHLDRYLSTQAHQIRGDLWQAVESLVAQVPEEERDRRRMVARQEDLRVDQAHPPTHLRHALLAAQPYTEPLVRAPTMHLIDRELEKLSDRLAKEVVDNARAALYA